MSLEARRGETIPPVGDGPGGLAWPMAERVVAIAREDALGLRVVGQWPAPADQLLVRMHPGAHEAWELVLEPVGVEANKQRVALRRCPGDPGQDPIDVRVVCLFGSEPHDAGLFPGLHALDVSHGPGVATALTLRALGEELTLPIEARGAPPAPGLSNPRWESIDESEVKLVELQLLDWQRRPAPNRVATLSVGPRAFFAAAGDDAIARFAVPPGTTRATVRYQPTDVGRLVELELRLGLSGVATDAGARARLANLGYPTEPDLTRGVRMFQQEHGLLPTGELDDPTRAALARVHDHDGGSGARDG